MSHCVVRASYKGRDTPLVLSHLLPNRRSFNRLDPTPSPAFLHTYTPFCLEQLTLSCPYRFPTLPFVSPPNPLDELTMAPLTSKLSFPSLSAARKHHQPPPLVISAPQKLRPVPASCKKRGRENEYPPDTEDTNPRTRRRTASIWNGVIRRRRPTTAPAPPPDARRSVANILFGDEPSVRLRKPSNISSRRPSVAVLSRQPSCASIAARPRAPTPGAMAASAIRRGSGTRNIFKRIRKSLTRSRGSSVCAGSCGSGTDSDSEHLSDWVLGSDGRTSRTPPPLPPKPEWMQPARTSNPPYSSTRSSNRIQAGSPMEPMSVVSSVYDDESVQDYGEIVRDSNGLLRLGAHDLKLNVVLLRTSLVADGSDANQSIACQLGLHITVTDEERWRSSALAAPDITLLDVRLSCEPVTVSTRSTKPSRRWLCQPNGSLAELVDCRRQSGLAIGSDWTRTNCDVRTLASKRATDWRSARGWIKTVRGYALTRICFDDTAGAAVRARA
ncbi:hypothetical protein BD626DRAFT_498289 [Schizophyllum amplum]|uniref:Uncharacterized protein n=1 Tax=Schizophyllum amplum TaxID=97359 RepID=A0A550CD48_9AGAR|nr:hypothetical protein BD626DRAFT_498289 [Auriculariopsis ampla]